MFIGMGLTVLLMLPIITFFFAKRMGRNPKVWFLIGCVLPGIASVILFILPDLSDTEKGRVKIEE